MTECPTGSILGDKLKSHRIKNHIGCLEFPLKMDFPVTLQATNMSHLGKRKIIFKSDFWWDMLVPRRVSNNHPYPKQPNPGPCGFHKTYQHQPTTAALGGSPPGVWSPRTRCPKAWGLLLGIPHDEWKSKNRGTPKHGFPEHGSIASLWETGLVVGMLIMLCSFQKSWIRVFPKIGVHQNGWFIMENPI